MKSVVVRVMVLSLVLFCAVPAFADERADAVKLVKDAVAYLNANGLEKTLDALNDPKGPFIKGNLYVFSYDLNGVMMANYVKPALIGQNVLEVPDSRGKKFRKEIVERAKKEGSGWVDYVTDHPKTKLPEEKTTYFEKVGDLIFACGTYKK